MNEREDLERRLVELRLALNELEREQESIVWRLKLLKASEPEPVFASSQVGSVLGTSASLSVPAAKKKESAVPPVAQSCDEGRVRFPFQPVEITF